MIRMGFNQMEINVNTPNDIVFEILRSCSCGTIRDGNNTKTTQYESIGTKEVKSCSCCTSKNESDSLKTQIGYTKTTIKSR